MSWMASLFGSNVVSQVAAAIGVPSRTVAAAKDIPNPVNSGIGVPFNAKADAEERAGGMKMQRVTAAGAAKAKPNDAIARQFGM